MKVSTIVALDANNAIGAGNKLVWHLPDDFKWFKEKTMGKPMIMGRNTMNSLGKPLPKRVNIVVSSSDKDIIDGFIHVKSVQEALDKIDEGTEEVMVIGGGMLYKSMLDICDRMYITRINHSFEDMDTFYPTWNENEWVEVYNEHHDKDDRHAYDFNMIIYDRITKA